MERYSIFIDEPDKHLLHHEMVSFKQWRKWIDKMSREETHFYISMSRDVHATMSEGAKIVNVGKYRMLFKKNTNLLERIRDAKAKQS